MSRQQAGASPHRDFNDKWDDDDDWPKKDQPKK
ncbi:hypothetical protein ACP0HM_13385 [Escherichia coli]